MVDRNRFEILEEHIENMIDHCREAGIIVCDYQSSISFQKKINYLVSKLQDIDRMQIDVQDVHVPIELFAKIDAGQNPQLFTRECMEQALGKNEAVRGKLESLRRFRALLMTELSRQFPNEIAKYRAVRGDPEALGIFPLMSAASQSNGSGLETSIDSASLR